MYESTHHLPLCFYLGPNKKNIYKESSSQTDEYKEEEVGD